MPERIPLVRLENFVVGLNLLFPSRDLLNERRVITRKTKMSTLHFEIPTIVNTTDAFDLPVSTWSEDRGDDELFTRRLAWDIVQERARFVPRAPAW
jgi:hypothetical protein